MKVFITKYALTGGIEEREAEECGSDMVKIPGSYSQYFHGEGREWHKTIESATAKAEEMRAKKIASLKKSIAKLERLKF